MKKLLPLFLIIFISCDDETPKQSINSFEPKAGKFMSTVIIKGANFNTNNPENIVVKFGSAQAKVLSSSSSEITAEVPYSAVTGKIVVEIGDQKTISEEDFLLQEGVWRAIAVTGEHTNVNAHSHSFKVPVNGKFYVVNPGSAFTKMETFDPVTETWTSLGETLGAGIPNVAYWSSPTKAKAFVVSGFTENGTDNFTEFDPLTRTFSEKTFTPMLGVDVVYAFSIGDRGYVIFKTALLHRMREYNALTEVWEEKQLFTSFKIDKLNYPLMDVSEAENKAFFIDENKLFIYDATADTWSEKKALPDVPEFCFFVKGKFYAGMVSKDHEVWVYDTNADAWTPTSTFIGAAVVKDQLTGVSVTNVLGFTIGDKAYIGPYIYAYANNLYPGFYEFIPY